MNISHKSSVQLFYSVGSEDWKWVSELIENNMTSGYFSGEFSSVILLSWKRRLKVSELIENNMTSGYFSGEFSSAILLSWKRRLKVSEWVDRK
jgi:hypothetical protein